MFTVLFAAVVHAQQPSSKCQPDPDALSLAIIGDMFNNDPAFKNDPGTAKAFIRIHVQPWREQDDTFYLIRLVGEKDPPERNSLSVKYSLPKGSKTIRHIVEKLLKNEPCLNARQFAKKVHIKRIEKLLSGESAKLANQVFDMKITPSPLDHSSVRLDAPLYSLEVLGDFRLRIISDDHELEIVKWLEKLLSSIDHES